MIVYTAYILKSEKTGSYYIGSSDDHKKRIVKHNKGYSRYTKGKGPFILVYKEEFYSRSEAKKREYYLKSLKSRKALEKIINSAPVV